MALNNSCVSLRMENHLWPLYSTKLEPVTGAGRAMLLQNGKEEKARGGGGEGADLITTKK